MKGTDKTTTITIVIVIVIICAMCLIPIISHRNYLNNDKNNPLETSETVDSIYINTDSTGLSIIGVDNYNTCEYESHNMYIISESEEPVYMHIADSCKLCKADTINKIPDVTFIRVKWEFKNK